MVESIGSALKAYQQASANGITAGLDARDQEGPNFADMLKGAVQDAAGVQQTGEAATVMAAAGDASLTDVVTAVSNAEVMLQSVVAVRDRAVQAYQEILRMPM